MYMPQRTFVLKGLDRPAHPFYSSNKRTAHSNEERTMDSLIIATFVVVSSVYLLWQFLERGVLDDR
jgi:hypothetical protein